MKRRMTAAALCLALLAWTPALRLQAEEKSSAAGSDDVVLQAMRLEMERSKGKLKLEQMAAPYYIEYRVVELEEVAAEAAFGALRNHGHVHVRMVRAVVRVGDYKQDSYFGEGEGVVNFLPVDNDLLGLRHQLWLATDQAYKMATEALTAKQAQLKQFTVEQPVDDFARAAAVESLGPLVKLEIDPQPWIKLVQDASGLYQGDAEVQTFESSLRFAAVNRYFMNSEGTMVRDGRTFYAIGATGSTQAPDGMKLERSNGDTVTQAGELPAPDKFLARTTRLLATLKQLRAAPVAEEEYRGPVLFSADAASSIFADFIGENVRGLKPDLGQPARTKGAFATSYKSRVLPDFLSVVDDPGVKAQDRESLVGSYEIDDEGVRAARVPIVEKGKLENYLMGRAPIRDFPASNGHGRAWGGAAPAPSLGNLIVSSSEPVPKEEMKKKLVELCRQRELPYGYYVETLGPRRTPRLLYKVWVKDGREELVRGAVFGDLDTRTLRNDLIAAGNDMNVDNRVGGVPHSIVNPSILFDELEVKRADANKEKLPEYPPPALK